MDEVVANKHIQVLIPPESQARAEPRPGWTGGRYQKRRWPTAVPQTTRHKARTRMKSLIEPLFAQTKHNPGSPGSFAQDAQPYAPNGDH